MEADPDLFWDAPEYIRNAPGEVRQWLIKMVKRHRAHNHKRARQDEMDGNIVALMAKLENLEKENEQLKELIVQQQNKMETTHSQPEHRDVTELAEVVSGVAPSYREAPSFRSPVSNIPKNVCNAPGSSLHDQEQAANCAVKVDTLELREPRSWIMQIPEFTTDSVGLDRIVAWGKCQFPNKGVDEFKIEQQIRAGVFYELCDSASCRVIDHSNLTSLSKKKYNGNLITILCHVPDGKQTSQGKANHFVVAIVDRRKGKFTHWGMQKELANQVQSQIQKELGRTLQAFPQQLGNYTGNVCLLQCVTAVRSYLEQDVPKGDHVDIRHFYLRLLLENWRRLNNKACDKREPSPQPAASLSSSRVALQSRLGTSTRIAQLATTGSVDANIVIKDEQLIVVATQAELRKNIDKIPQFLMADFGESLASRIVEKLGLNFSGVVHIEDFSPIDANDLKEVIRAPQEDYDLVGVEYKTYKGQTTLCLASSAGFKMPEFPALSAPREDPETFVENLVSHSPEGIIPYYVGPSLAVSSQEFDKLLHPGKLTELVELRKTRGNDGECHVSGVTNTWWLMGSARSGTAIHHEDGDFRSVNITLIGEKVWLLIETEHSRKFEDFVTKIVGRSLPRCDQWIRHYNLLFGPSQLKKAGIKFRVLKAGPGDMVVTEPGQYHLALNMTPCVAVAINILLPDEPLFPDRCIGVCEECGLSFAAYEEIGNVMLLPVASAPSGQSLRRQPRQELQAQLRPRVTNPTKRPSPYVDHQSTKKPKNDANAKDLAECLLGKDALKRFEGLVSEWNKRGTMPSFKIAESTPNKKAQAYYKLGIEFDSKTALTTLLAWYARILTHKEMENTKPDGFRRLANGTMSDFYKGLKLKIAYDTFREYIKVARKFATLGDLLVFLPFDSTVSMSNWKQIKFPPDLETHITSHSSYREYQQLGKHFLESILKNTDCTAS